MNTFKPICAMSGAALALWFLFAPWSVLAEPAKPGPQPDPKDGKAKPIESALVYKPPVRGTPGGRVGGGTRGTSQTFVLSVLAPNHTGLTSRDQPILYWYVTKPISSPMEFSLSDDGVKPLVETVLKPPFEAGIQRIRLADFGVRLVAGRQYRWFVSLVVDPERRSKNILAGGTIELAEVPEATATLISRADKQDMPRAYAEAGLWYDAVAAINELIGAAPKDNALRAQRAALLQQVGLAEIAEFDLTGRNN